MKTRGEVVRISTDRIRPFATQPREYFDADELASLEASIKQRGQIQPGLIKELDGEDFDFELVDGQRRWTACARLGVPFCAVIIEPENEAEQYEISVTANFQSSEHTPMEIAKACRRIYESGRSEAYIGNLFGKSQFWVSSKLHLNKLIPELQDLLDPVKTTSRDLRLPSGLAENLARLPEEEQRIRFKEIQKNGHQSINTFALRQELKKAGEIKVRTICAADHARFTEAFIARLIDETSRLHHRLTSVEGLAESFSQLKKLGHLHEQLQLAEAKLSTIRTLIEEWIVIHPVGETPTERAKKHFFSPQRAAKEVGVSLRHFRRLAEEFEPIEIGRNFFYRPEHVEQIKLLRFEMEAD